MGVRGEVARSVLLHVNLLLAMYGGAALVTGSLIYWHGKLTDRTLEGLSTTLALSVSGVALLLLTHAGAVATRRKALLFFALGSWATALGMLGATGWLIWRSMRFDICGNIRVKPYLCAFLFIQIIVDKKNQLLFMDEASLELYAYVVAALLLLLQLLLLLAGVMALYARNAPRLASDRTHSMFRRSSSMSYESRAPLAPFVSRPPPASSPLYMNPMSMSPPPPPPVGYTNPYTQ